MHAIAIAPSSVIAAIAAMPLLAAPTQESASVHEQSTVATAGVEIRTNPRVAVAVEKVRVWLEAQRAYTQIPGVSFAIVHDQELVATGGFGRADLSLGRIASADTIYSICSISKLFTSIAIMQLRDKGKLRLDDAVAQHLPWFQLRRSRGEGEITIEGILTHASGLPRESDYPYWSGPDFISPSRDDLVRRIREQDALYAPEAHFQYSNLGLALAGEIVAAASHLSYATYVRKNILDPLAMNSTYSDMPASERGKRLATGYSALTRKGTRDPMPFLLAKPWRLPWGYASTARDLARFASWQFRLLRNGGDEVLRATSLREMYRVHWMEPDLQTIWGLGFGIVIEDGKLAAAHDGSCPGYRTVFGLVPDDMITIVFLTDAQGVEVMEYLKPILRLLTPAIRAAVKDPGKGEPVPAALQKYVGTYATRAEDGEVVKLKQLGPDTFRRVRADDALGEEIVFELGPDGMAKRFKRYSDFHERIALPAP